MSPFNSPHDDAAPGPIHRRFRWRIFLSVFVVISLVGGAYVYSRSPVYRALTTVLAQQTRNLELSGPETKTEHLAIQERQLLSDAVLQKLLDQLHPAYPQLDMTALQKMLRVNPIANTNLLTIDAQGSRPKLLADLVNTWASSYEAYRINQVQQASGRSTEELQDRRQQLTERIKAARANLAEFRRSKQIIGIELGDNQAIAGLRGINHSLNKAREQLVDAQARREALAEALRRGENVVPAQMRAGVNNLRSALQRDQARLTELKQRYTMRYIEIDPTLKELPGRVRAEKQALAARLKLARQTAIEDAENAVDQAASAVSSLKSKLTTQQQKVQQFNDNYQQFKTLKDQLSGLEGMLNDTQKELDRIQVSNLKKFPPIQIVDPAGVPTLPIRPHYQHDMGIVLGIAFVLALFATWLVEYLNGRQSSGRDRMPRIDLNIYPNAQALAEQAPPAPLRMGAAPAAAALNAPQQALPLLTRELTQADIRTLLSNAPPTYAAAIALLLSGVTPHELGLLDGRNLETTQRTLTIPGDQPRLLPLPEPTWDWLTPLLQTDATLPVAHELDQTLLDIALAERIHTPTSVTTVALWQSYLLHLARQGVSREALEARVGRLPGGLLAQLDQFASAHAGTLGRVDYLHPALLHPPAG